MTKVSVTLEVEVDNDWIEYCTKYNDLFMPGYCGYWMCEMEHDEELGWLCYEYDWGGDEVKPISDVRIDPTYDTIVEDWRAGKVLPDHWYRLNQETAVQSWVAAVKRYGTDWYTNGQSDATTYDVAVQTALLGEVVYG